MVTAHRVRARIGRALFGWKDILPEPVTTGVGGLAGKRVRQKYIAIPGSATKREKVPLITVSRRVLPSAIMADIRWRSQAKPARAAGECQGGAGRALQAGPGGHARG